MLAERRHTDEMDTITTQRPGQINQLAPVKASHEPHDKTKTNKNKKRKKQQKQQQQQK